MPITIEKHKCISQSGYRKVIATLLKTEGPRTVVSWSNMPSFRLLNIVTLAVEEFDLDDHPKYLAASHAWIENVFGNNRDGFNDCFGGRGIRTIIAQIYPDIEHCWVDRLCINQRDKQDKLIQIPLMERIFTQASAVVVLISTEIGADQNRIDEVVESLQGAVAMYDAESWQEQGQFWQQGEGRNKIIFAMRGLLRLASTVWATRVWTLQEYVLARTVYWIGLDYKPIRIDDHILSALPDVCNTLAIEEALTSEMLIVYSHLQGMANFRLGNIDRTRVMELLGNRTTKKSVDEIYGSMSASGVIIKPVANESKYEAWRRWCETAVMQGHIRWILLPTSGKPPEDGEEWNCILPYFAGRDRISASSRLDHVKPLHAVNVSNGCVTLSARKIGTVEIIRRVGKVHQPLGGRIHRDITLILFAKAKWKLALQLVAAFGGGRYSTGQAKAIAHVIVQSYFTAVASVLGHSEDHFRPVFHSQFQLYVWNDFMQLQESQMIGLNEGTGYLCRVQGNYIDGDLITVIVGGDSMSEVGLEALDFEAVASDGRSVLMIVQSSPCGETTRILHKVAMTLPVSDDVSSLWAEEPSVIVSLGGRECYHCNENRINYNSGSLLGVDAPETNLHGRTNVTSSSITRGFMRQLSIVMRKVNSNRLLAPLRRGKLTRLVNVRQQTRIYLRQPEKRISLRARRRGIGR